MYNLCILFKRIAYGCKLELTCILKPNFWFVFLIFTPCDFWTWQSIQFFIPENSFLTQSYDKFDTLSQPVLLHKAMLKHRVISWQILPNAGFNDLFEYDWYSDRQQSVGIHTGTKYAPLLADIFMYSHEAEFIQK